MRKVFRIPYGRGTLQEIRTQSTLSTGRLSQTDASGAA
jgi:hypothetical protein